MEDTLNRLQDIQIEMLDVIDSICATHDIQYSLYAGTLLGAVRHHGFIPWDDDLDICMSRSEYNRFLKIWEQMKPEGYILQNKENSPAFMHSFSKIRKLHTTYLEHKEDIGRFHTGIFVNVFPIDRIPDGNISRLSFQWNCLEYQLLTREYIPPQGTIIEKTAAKIILNTISQKTRQNKREKLLRKITEFQNPGFQTVAIETVNTIKMPLPDDLLDSYVYLPFENKKYMCFSNWNKYLTIKYGNYMQLPPEEERIWKHRPLILDFEHDVEELEQMKCLEL